MKKRVEVGALKLGMYVCELDRPWQDTPFGVNSFAIETSEQISQLREYCTHVYTETDLETPEPATQPDPLARLKGFSRLDQPELELEILKKYSHPACGQGLYIDSAPVEQEIATIRETHEQASALMEDIMREVRHGRNINTVATQEVVSELTDSIIRNPDALMCFTRMRQTHAATAQHGLRTCILALALGRHVGMPKSQLHDLGIGALLHDIGKTRVPTEILNCGHELTAQESAILRRHVVDGISILESTPDIPLSAVDLARYHHEHYDGSGYMLGLGNNEISQFGHIGAIVDFYDNMTHDRPGSRATVAHNALKIMYQQRGRLFHPQLVEEFIRCMGIYPIGSIVEMLSGEVGVVVALNRERRLKPRVALVVNSDNCRFDKPRIVDLTQHRNTHGEMLEIAHVADNNNYDFDPLDYLPIVA